MHKIELREGSYYRDNDLIVVLITFSDSATPMSMSEFKTAFIANSSKFYLIQSDCGGGAGSTSSSAQYWGVIYRFTYASSTFWILYRTTTDLTQTPHSRSWSQDSTNYSDTVVQIS